MSDRVNLQKRRDTFKKLMQQLSSKYEGLKAQLNENETFTQVRELRSLGIDQSMYIFASTLNVL